MVFLGLVWPPGPVLTQRLEPSQKAFIQTDARLAPLTSPGP